MASYRRIVLLEVCIVAHKKKESSGTKHHCFDQIYFAIYFANKVLFRHLFRQQ